MMDSKMEWSVKPIAAKPDPAETRERHIERLDTIVREHPVGFAAHYLLAAAMSPSMEGKLEALKFMLGYIQDERGDE